MTMQLPNIAKLKNYISINDLFALTIAIMLVGHTALFFVPDNLWLRIADRIFIPVLLISIGYNIGHKIGWSIYIGAALIMAGQIFVTYGPPINILAIFIALKFFLDPFVKLISRNKILFWGVNFVMAFVSPFVNLLFEYGTLAIIMATAGWINRNRDEVKTVTTILEYYIFSYFSFLWFTWIVFGFSSLQMLCIALGVGLVMYLLLDYKTLILNSLKRKPKDVIEKICTFMARKSLEIYVFHVLFYMLIVYIATHNLS
jgi:hypothetical protein